MSASNWAECPQCADKAHWNKAKLLEKASEMYGKVSPAEYNYALEQARKPVALKETLREDYELGVDAKGEFWMYYSCSCDCGYEFKFQHKQKTNMKRADVQTEPRSHDAQAD